MNLFSFDKEVFKFDKNKPIKLFEAFAGIGTQAMALKRLGLQLDHIGISEIDKWAIQNHELIHGKVKNYGSITDIKGQDLPLIDIFTYSFPCQDLSKAGRGAGLQGDTRSGLVYDTIRVLQEMKVKPKVLLMENVPDLLNANHTEGWHEIYNEIETMGYSNYVGVLNAKDYGIPQNRNRVFMISILGEYAYTYPNGFDLELRLKDKLEEVVDESYYLTQKQIEQISAWNAQQKPLDNAKYTEDETIQTITAKSNTSMNASMLLIKEATVRGFKEAFEGDGIYINRPHQKRGVVQTDMIQTLKVGNNDLGVVVDKPVTLNGKVNGKQPSLQDRIYDSNAIVTAITTVFPPNYTENLWVRKLTPREAWRLMGISDNDFDKVKDHTSNSQLYKQAGNAIVVDVLYYIFRGLL